MSDPRETDSRWCFDHARSKVPCSVGAVSGTGETGTLTFYECPTCLRIAIKLAKSRYVTRGSNG